MADPTQTNKAFGQPPQDRRQTGGGLLGSFTFAQFQFSSIIIVLAASGLVPFEDVICVLGGSMYFYVLGRFVFPPVTPDCPPSLYEGSKLLQLYVTISAYVGLYLPLVYIFLGVAMGDKKAVEAAVPHTFLLACQVLTEQITSTSHGVSLPLRALIPILYNGGRLIAIWLWIRTDFFKGAHEVSIPVENEDMFGKWVFFGRALALANMGLWGFNICCFLIPFYLPKCFRKYFEDEKVWAEKNKSH